MVDSSDYFLKSTLMNEKYVRVPEFDYLLILK